MKRAVTERFLMSGVRSIRSDGKRKMSHFGASFPDVEVVFADRRDGGRAIVDALGEERWANVVVVGLARGGVATAAEVARALEAPLDVIAVRKIGHPSQPEYGLGAVTPDGGVYLRTSAGLTSKQISGLVTAARLDSQELDRRYHSRRPPLDLAGRTVVVVDDGLATGATMIAALRSVRAAGAAWVVAAVPVGAVQSLRPLMGEADEVVCPHPLARLYAVGVHYGLFDQIDDAEVLDLVDQNRRFHQVQQPTSPISAVNRRGGQR
jgi:predicted phosphoribosyltransferase